uniref:Uncharacterized protein n=1 Tax=Gracilaria robusta TaxID=38400 RepID=O46325_9FLOR|nr:ORF4 [Gracilaria robusta]
MLLYFNFQVKWMKLMDWNIVHNDEFNTKLNLNTLNFVGCLVFILLFIIYFFVFSSICLFILSNINKSMNNLKDIADMSISSKKLNLLNSENKSIIESSSINSNEFNQTKINDDFLKY